MMPCAFPAVKCFPACSGFPIALRIGTSAGSCFPMLPQRLPRSGNLFRTDFRFAPSSRSASLAGPSIHEGMDAHGLCGRVPDSAGNVSPWIAYVHRIATAQT